MTPAVRLTLTGSGFFLLAGTVVVTFGLAHEHPVRTEPTPADPPSKLVQAIERAAPELLDPRLAPPPPATFVEPAPPPPSVAEVVLMPPLDVATRPRPPVQKTAADVGYVRVSTQPWGWATVGGQRIETIGSGRLTLSPGRHTVTVHCAECTPHRTATRVVTIKPNMTELILISWDEERARERAASMLR